MNNLSYSMEPQGANLFRLTPSIHNMPISILIIIYTFFCNCSALTATIGVDWGEQFVKVSIGYRGYKPDILLNDTGSRKFQNAVSFDRDVRLFDKDVSANISKSPSSAINNYAHLLGVPIQGSSSDEMSKLEPEDVAWMLEKSGVKFNWEYYPYEFWVSNDGQLHLKITRDSTMSVEEAASHFFNYIKETIISRVKNAKVLHSDDETCKIMALIAIPCGYTQRQRRAIKFAAEGAGLYVIGMVHGIAAAAFMRTFEMEKSDKTVLFYDLGSYGANVGVVELQIPKSSESPSMDGLSQNSKGESQIRVLSCVTVPGIGGEQHDIALAEYLRKTFEIKHNVKLMPNNPKALQKILRAAKEAKTALTVGESVTISIEGLLKDVDFHVVVTRDTFEGLLQSVIDKLDEPVLRAIDLAQIQLENIDSVELIGGAWRVPAVKRKIASIVEPRSLGFHLNAEEAIAIGSGYLAAAYNPFFRMKKANVFDNSALAYYVQITSIDTDSPNYMDKKADLYKPDSLSNAQKTVKFRTLLDFKVGLGEGDQQIAVYKITGVKDLLALEENAGKLAQVTLIFSCGKDGIINLTGASAIPVENLEEIAKHSTEDLMDIQKSYENNSDTVSDGKDVTYNENETKEYRRETNEEGVKRTSTKNIEYPLTVTLETGHLYTSEKVESLKTSIETFSKRDRDIIERSEQKNLLESLIYKYKSIVKTQSFKEATTEDVLCQLKEKVKYLEEWFDTETESASTQVFKDKIEELNGIALPIYERMLDNLNRESLINVTNKALEKLKQKLDSLQRERPYILNEVSTINIFNGIIEWWEDLKGKQQEIPPNEEPIFTSEQVKLKMEIAQHSIKLLENLKPPKADNKSVTDGSNSNEDGSQGSDEKISGGEETVKEETIGEETVSKEAIIEGKDAVQTDGQEKGEDVVHTDGQDQGEDVVHTDGQDQGEDVVHTDVQGEDESGPRAEL